MRRGTFFWGGILVLVGLVLLLDNLNVFGNIDAWNMIWPLFLILLGAWILWGTVFRKSTEKEHVRLPLEGAGKASLRVQHGAGRLNISSGAEAGILLEGDFGGGLQKSLRRDGDTLSLNMSVPVGIFPFFWTPGETLDWSFSLADQVPLRLEVEAGANDARLDLEGLQLTELSVKSGASSTRIVLPAHAGHTRVRISSGAASVEIQVPHGVAARIRKQSGLAEIKVDQNRFPRSGNAYESPDYDLSQNKVDMDVEMGVGSIQIY